jgi:hypothetical protein
MPVEALFNQLTEGVAFAVAGNEDISHTQVIRIGYNLIQKTGLFELPCREWRQKPAESKSMTAFQTHFRDADQDRMSTATTATVSYHNTANHVEQCPTTAPTSTNGTIIAEAVQKQVALALAAMQLNPTTTCTAGQRSYCWTHGSTRNLRHTSQTCRFPATGHKTTATPPTNLGAAHKTLATPRNEGRLQHLQVRVKTERGYTCHHFL